MNTRHCISFALAVCLLLVIPAYGQDAQVDLDSKTDRLPPEMERLRAALPPPIAAKLSILNQSADGFVFRHLPSSPFVPFASSQLAKANVWLLTEQISQDWDAAANGGSGDWLNESRVGYTRNSAGVPTERLIDEWEAVSETWLPGLRTTYLLNDQNRSEESLDEAWNPDANGGQGDWEPSRRVLGTYDGDGNSLVRTTELWDDSTNEWFVWFRSTSTYENGRRVQLVSESIDFFTGMLGFSLRNSFEYDGAGRTTRRIVETYDDATSEWKNSTARVWTYDGQGQETEDLELNWDESANGGQGDWVNDYREVSTYSTNPDEMTVTAQDWDATANGGQGDWINRERGLLTATSLTGWVETEQDWDPDANGGQGDWVNRDQQLVTLDSNGDFVEFVEQTWDPAAAGGQGDWVNESRGSFVYNSDRLLTENLIQVWDGAQWVNDSRLLQMYQEFTGTALEDDNPEVRFKLQANYPNPFKSETTIRFALPAAQHVTLEVFDLLGRRITTLVDGQKAPGNHEVVLEAKGMAGGLYVYRLTGDHVQTSRTMLHVR
ncbi:MAG: T9SS type A sorting domain-containing protein [Rhodothermales bacterium]|nr:T9SS type A sorting domain-containing protein [Rhodothermales bacterium]